jgi:hypothetical protein
MREQFNAPPVVRAVLRKMSAGQEVEFEEQYAWLQYTLNTFRMYENQWFQHKRGMLDDTLFRGYQSHIYLTLDSPSASAFWEQTKVAFFHPEFVAHVGELLKNRPDMPKTPMTLA